MQRFSRFSFLLSAALCLGLAAQTPNPAHAEYGNAEMKPLVVIRFNQPRVYYDRELYSAVSQAVAAKPDVMFDIVSNAPSTGDSGTDSQWIKTASHNTQAVVASMQKIGVPMARMHITGQAQAGLRFDETRVYVR